jgi:hypothetical protein
MIYDSLHILPKFIQIQIYESGDLSLLTDQKFFSIDRLSEVWENLELEFNDKYNKFESNKIFNLSREIVYLVGKYQEIKYSCEALLFNKNEDLIHLLLEYGYSVTQENYSSDIEKINRESEGIINKINQFKKLLPQPKSDIKPNDTSIIDVMAGYSSVVGYDFDYYKISVVKFHAIEKTVQQKIKSLEANNSKNKKS